MNIIVGLYTTCPSHANGPKGRGPFLFQNNGISLSENQDSRPASSTSRERGTRHGQATNISAWPNEPRERTRSLSHLRAAAIPRARARRRGRNFSVFSVLQPVEKSRNAIGIAAPPTPWARRTSTRGSISASSGSSVFDRRIADGPTLVARAESGCCSRHRLGSAFTAIALSPPRAIGPAACRPAPRGRRHRG